MNEYIRSNYQLFFFNENEDTYQPINLNCSLLTLDDIIRFSNKEVSFLIFKNFFLIP